jgi:hypothetical protein
LSAAAELGDKRAIRGMFGIGCAAAEKQRPASIVQMV